MSNNINVRISDLVYGLSCSLDLVSPPLVNYHRQVFSFAAKIAESFDRISDQEKSDVLREAAPFISASAQREMAFEVTECR